MKKEGVVFSHTGLQVGWGTPAGQSRGKGTQNQVRTSVSDPTWLPAPGRFLY